MSHRRVWGAPIEEKHTKEFRVAHQAKKMEKKRTHIPSYPNTPAAPGAFETTNRIFFDKKPLPTHEIHLKHPLLPPPPAKIICLQDRVNLSPGVKNATRPFTETVEVYIHADRFMRTSGYVNGFHPRWTGGGATGGPMRPIERHRRGSGSTTSSQQTSQG
jgi:hypothetical protein